MIGNKVIVCLIMVELLSQNVRGLGQEFKRRKVFNWLHNSNASIIFLQETHSTSNDERVWKTEWGGPNVVFAHGESNARGVCILFKNNVTVEIHKSIVDEFGRFIILDATVDSMKMVLCNVYGPNHDNPHFFITLFEQIDSLEESNLIIAGDFNSILDPNMDKFGGNPHKNKNSRDALNALKEELELVDIWRTRNPQASEFTFRCMKPEKIFSRLDYFLISASLCDMVEESSIRPGYLSDHSNVRIKLVTTEIPRGRGFWKFNCQLLHDSEYIDIIKNTIKDISAINKGADPHLMWETLKVAIRSSTIEFASRKKKSKENIVTALEHRLHRLEQLLQKQHSENIEKSVNEIREELDIHIAEKTRGSMIRSRARWVEEGEHSSKYFFNLEKRNYNTKTMKGLRKKDNTITSDTKEILNELVRFYKHLYSSRFKEDQPSFQVFENLEGPKVIEDDRVALNGPIRENEILQALKSCKNNKTPGSDGLPAEFYKVFWQDIKEYLIASYQYSHDIDSLSYSQKQGIITILPKKDKDVLLVKNWRPISLLNVDYKLLAKVIATRIKKVVHYLINGEQTGFINGRYIGENIVKILSILEYCEENEIPAVLIAIDFEKAYDSLEWQAVEYAFNFFQFGPELIKWIRIFYNGINSSVVNNGYLSDYFQLERGVRQGCPLSPYLYIVVAELLAIMIRSNEDIEGIDIDGTLFKIMQFADDTTILSMFTEKSIAAIFQTFDIFEGVTGLKINYDKTELLRIGSLCNTHAKLYTQKPVNWTNDPLLILGVNITQSRKGLIEANFPQLLVKIQNISKIWNMRNLTIYGKVLISKSLLISQLTYKLSMLPTPNIEYLKEVNALISKFIWSNKPPRIAKDTLLLPIDKGGLNLIDLFFQEKGLKISWVKRILEETKQDLRKLAGLTIPDCDGLIWEANLKIDDVDYVRIGNKGNVWDSILRAWCSYNYKEPVNVDEIMNQTLWYNTHIRRQNKPFIIKALYNIGLCKIQDIVITEQGAFQGSSEFSLISGSETLKFAYNQLLSAIPQKWKLIVRQQYHTDIYTEVISNVKSICKVEKVTKFIHQKMAENLPVDLSRKLKWEEDLSIAITENDWLSLFSNMYEATIYNKLRFLQFRLLYRILVTNVHRCRWGLLDTDLCTFCGVAPESYIHLFVQCEYSNILWTKFFTWLARTSGLKLNYSPKELLFGITNNNSIDKLVNTLLLIVKQYIYSVKCQGRMPIFNELGKRIYKMMLVERYLAYKNSKWHKFNEKWGIIEW